MIEVARLEMLDGGSLHVRQTEDGDLRFFQRTPDKPTQILSKFRFLTNAQFAIEGEDAKLEGLPLT